MLAGWVGGGREEIFFCVGDVELFELAVGHFGVYLRLQSLIEMCGLRGKIVLVFIEAVCDLW